MPYNGKNYGIWMAGQAMIITQEISSLFSWDLAHQIESALLMLSASKMTPPLNRHLFIKCFGEVGVYMSLQSEFKTSALRTKPLMSLSVFDCCKIQFSLSLHMLSQFRWWMKHWPPWPVHGQPPWTTHMDYCCCRLVVTVRKLGEVSFRSVFPRYSPY